ncbi:hypothetical protein [Pontibacter beigongshangensis]|uniref:hypothetical protein n=1 Tax=Pontibacter beigongshangensis TaxID=2574733 RepID=UPI001F513DB1|nr:hypothetical protein [Pontibacter beigongshangensis]
MILNIFKKGALVAFVAAIGFSCGQERPVTEKDTSTGTAEAIVEGNPSAANLNNPRPAPIGDTSKTGEQANRFGEMNPNQDSAARARIELDKQRQLEQNPDQKPSISTPERRIDGSGQ